MLVIIGYIRRGLKSMLTGCEHSTESEVPVPPLLAFTTDHVTRLTGLSSRVLRYWEETGVFAATFTHEDSHRPYRRLYSFRDVVGLRTLAMLRRQHHISLEELRRVGEFLSQHDEAPWASLRFQVAGRHVVFNDPRSGVPISGMPLGQAVIEFKLSEIARDMESKAEQLRDRLPDDYGKLSRHRYVNHNAWVIAGTRIPTTAIWNLHEDGYDTPSIIAEYPQLRPEDVEAAVAHERTERKILAA